ncbi:MAG: sodium:proton antiporter [Rikenellaceae bacterium]|nr:sodium:proton antiporter [Rikenellaceae bacterium]
MNFSNFFSKYKAQTPLWIAAIPLLVLVVVLALVIKCFGADAIAGGSQIALLFAAAVAATLAITLCGQKWAVLEEAIVENIRTSASAIIILLLIGAISGTWMLSGTVPTLICYGLEVIHPKVFLGVACIICALVSLVTGSSWTTIATIGVALMGIGQAMGFSEGWIAGAIISGAYFGDKVSALSDTTVLASAASKVPLFEHIKYMMITTVPSFTIALLVFFGISFFQTPQEATQIEQISQTLHATFNISPWLLIVPLVTALLILRKLPALITLFAATVVACIAMLIFQPDIVAQIGGEGSLSSFRGLMIACSSTTAIDTGDAMLNDLVATRGMGGMLPTIWLILCAMCFGGVMAGSGMLAALTRLFMRFAKRTVSVVSSTIATGVFCNLTTADQYISIIITGNTFGDLYRQRGLEGRLLSRSVEDSATVTSVLIPWNSCGMTQSTVLGVATITYLPYCLFNLFSPIISIIVAAVGYKIVKKEPKDE